ncbi:import inner membrane translocase subunit Tim44 [Solidesulfovibrio carbinoliphilus subsp. oakridgensis]|uniref:Import inner membrane translocase subunit Tim44 n=1 Tax=Solidesulfovibrio carbinoliphilus subsp. oakridgensis TaxID=694327 RepID=G7Q5P6_9BACT|nr:import inner membrane translocase subunit Tim44 [Solidesulfovibrio carbinoliphilus]EHJ49605.1 import inner membrane translocase subunit Tim44 [Solidesulfovibrio carbinoliphilus subsp. oakridgensis]
MDTHPGSPKALAALLSRIPSRTLAAAVGLALALPSPARAEDLLTGGLLGSVFRGDDFTGPRLVDLAVLGLALFLVLRLLLGRTGKTGANQQPPPPPPPAAYDDEAPPPLDSPPGKPNMYTNAQATWAALKSPPPKGTPTTAAPSGATGPLPSGATPEQEFLAGAKLAYGRILAAMAKRDFDDLANFTTPLFLAQLKNSLPASPPPAPEILLVEAVLAGERQESGRTVMDVDYEVLVHEPDAPHNTDRKERWRFVRDTAAPGAHWLLDGMERGRE